MTAMAVVDQFGYFAINNRQSRMLFPKYYLFSKNLLGMGNSKPDVEV